MQAVVGHLLRVKYERFKLACLQLRRRLMRHLAFMAALFRLTVGVGLLVLLVSVVWTSVFLSTRRHSSLLWTSSVFDPTDNRTWKTPDQLLRAASDGQFYLNSAAKRLVSGEFYYFRTHSALWDDRLRRLRTAGLNTITTRVPWNLHEPTPAAFHFHDLQQFINIVHRLGFLLIVHVGPYIDADWEYGGLPAWLLHDKHMVVRTSTYPGFLQYVERYFARLLPVLEQASYRKHGPVVAVQVENEFGSYTQEEDGDKEYMRTLVQLVRSHGIQELILTADRGPHLAAGSVTGAVATVTCHGRDSDVVRGLADLAVFQPKLPRLVTVMTSDGTARWGHTVPRQSSDEFRRTVDTVISSNASINIYAFAGGSNFGLWNGGVEDSGAESQDLSSVNAVRQAVRRRHRLRHRRSKQAAARQSAGRVLKWRPPAPAVVGPAVISEDQTAGGLLHYRPATTAYNYNPPAIVAQSGQCQDKYHVLRRLLLERSIITRLQTVPADPAVMALGVVRMDHCLQWHQLLSILPNSPIILDAPVFMELLNARRFRGAGQLHGWIVYRTRLPPLHAQYINVSGTMRDRAQLFLDSEPVATIFNEKLLAFNATISLRSSSTSGRTGTTVIRSDSRKGHLLEIVVENMGRASFGLLDEQRRGFEGVVIANSKEIKPLQWEHYPMDFQHSLLQTVKHTKHWTTVTRPLIVHGQGQPMLYRGHFRVKHLKDTYLDMSKWTKGLVVINGFVVGRYWNIGPQHCLYIPSVLLNIGHNELYVFELERTANAKVKFVAKLAEHRHKHNG